jgi:hypothetical protein
MGRGAEEMIGTLGTSSTTGAYHNMDKRVLQGVYKIGHKLYFDDVPEHVAPSAELTFLNGNMVSYRSMLLEAKSNFCWILGR